MPPSDLDAESAVLSAILLAPEMLEEVSFLQARHFYADANRWIFMAALDLRETGQPIDIVTVAGLLRDREKLQAAGGSPYLAQLSDATPAVAHIESHAKTIVSKWEVRQIIQTAQQIAAEGYGDYGDLEDWKQHVGGMIQNVTESGDPEKHLMLIGDATREVMKIVSDRVQNKGVVLTGVTTGLPTLDARLGGLEPSKKYVLAARPGAGKAQPLSAKVLTPTGWITMGQIRVGDWVIGGDGKPTKVKRIFERGTLPVFRVTMDDGGSTVCCDDHLWLTRNRFERRNKLPPSVKPLVEVRGKLQRCASGGLNHSVQYMGAVHFKKSGALPVDPYALGVYIGDGCHGGAVISNPETDVQRRFIRALPKSDEGWVSDDGITLRIRRRSRTRLRRTAFAEAIYRLGLGKARAQEKFIPEAYMMASVDDRMRLLRGLCDTDGYVEKPKSIEYVTVSKKLSVDVARLVRELGGYVSVAEKLPTYRYRGKKRKGQLAYRMFISFPAGGTTPVASRKHLKRWDSSPVRVSERFIKTVKREGTAVCRCIEVASPLHLYVTDDYIVTHNTAIATCMLLAVAKGTSYPRTTGDGVVFVSIEMPRVQIVFRFLSQISRIDSVKIQRGQLNSEEMGRLESAAQKLAELPIAIEDSSGHTLTSLRAAFRQGQRKLQEKHGKKLQVKVLGIDYLQLLGSENTSQNREAEIAALSRGTKAIAKNEGIAVLELAQVNRDCEKRPDKRPMLSDLRESGAIEQDADVVIFLYRDDMYKKEGDEKDDKAEIIVRKLRDNGGPGTVHCEFHPPTMTFSEGDRRNPDYEQLGDMFDDYLPGQGLPAEPPAGWQDDYDK